MSVTVAQPTLCAAARMARLCFGKFACKRRGEAHEIVLEDVVVGSERHQPAGVIVGDRARHDNEGLVAACRANHRQGLFGTEAGQGKIAQDGRPGSLVQRRPQIVCAVDDPDGGQFEAGALEVAQDEIGIRFTVLDDEKVQALSHCMLFRRWMR